MKFTKTFLLFIALIFVGPAAIAAQDSYSCFVRYAGKVDKAGDMDSAGMTKKSSNWLINAYVGSTFTINKNTGEVIGNIISNQGPNSYKTEILSRGNGGNYFKLLTVFGPNPSILYLEVQDMNASKSGEIPFVGFRWSEAISGTCF